MFQCSELWLIQRRGMFGLGTQPVNFTTIGNSSSPSYFSSLWSQKLIPSFAWSYTAGAKYCMDSSACIARKGFYLMIIQSLNMVNMRS